MAWRCKDESERKTPRRWLVVVVAATLFLPASRHVIAETSRNPTTLNVFGNWRIAAVPENKSLRLVGVVTEGSGAYFALQCFHETESIGIEVLLFKKSEQQRVDQAGTARITVWNEQSKPTTALMAVFEGRIAFASADKDKRHTGRLYADAFAFLSVLYEAKQFFSLDAGGPTRTYDAKHLPAALAMFRKLCGGLRAVR